MAANAHDVIPMPTGTITIPVDDTIPKMIMEAQRLVAFSKEFVIDCPELKEAAGSDLTVIRKMIKTADENRMKLTRPLDDAKKGIMTVYKSVTDLLDEADGIYKNKIKAYDAAEREKAMQLQRQLEEQARKEREKLARKVAEAEKAGQVEQAAALQIVAETVVAPIINTAPPKVSGVSSRKNWKGRVTDRLALIKAVAAGQVPDDVIEINDAALNRYAKAHESRLSFPGVEAYNDPTITTR